MVEVIICAAVVFVAFVFMAIVMLSALKGGGK